MTRSVIVTRIVVMRDVAIFDRRLQHHALVELADQVALNLLPGRLARWHIAEAAVPDLGADLRAASGQLVRRDENVRLPLLEVDAHAIVGPDQRQSSADRRLRCGVQDGWRAGGARLPA